MRDSSVQVYRMLADQTVSFPLEPRGLEKTDLLVGNQVMRDGSHAFATKKEYIQFLDETYNFEDKYKTHWYRSTETVLTENPYLNWLSQRTWPLNEELNMHMLMFQEVLTI